MIQDWRRWSLPGTPVADHDRVFIQQLTDITRKKSGVPRFFPDGFAVRNQDFVGISINRVQTTRRSREAVRWLGEKVEEPAKSRGAPARPQSNRRRTNGTDRHSPRQGAGTNERPDRAN